MKRSTETLRQRISRGAQFRQSSRVLTMARPKKMRWSDPERFTEICVRETERAIRSAFRDYERKIASFDRKWGPENMQIHVALSDCYFYYNPRSHKLTWFCTCEPSKDEPDIIVTATFEGFTSLSAAHTV